MNTAATFAKEHEDIENSAGDFFALLKPRVMSLVIFTGFVGMWLAPGFSDLHPLIMVMALLNLAIGAGAAGAINMWYDRDIDQIMTRTKTRPIPAGRVNADDALAFAVILSAFAIMMMGLTVNWVAAGILAFANIFYSVFYTMYLKRKTPQNIVIGGAAGAFPPMIGWAAVTGEITFDSFILFLIIFLWTPPHFWALSLFACKDYKRANIPMMNVVKGDLSTKKQMLFYSVILLFVSVIPAFTGIVDQVYGFIAGGLSLFFVYTAIKTLNSDDLKYAKLMFSYSVFYLFALFLSMIFLS